MRGLQRLDAGGQDGGAQGLVERADLDHETAGEPRADALVERLEIGRRTVRRHHDLAAGIDQRIERVAEFLLDLLALDELHVVEDEQVDAAQPLLEGERRLRLQGGDEAVHEAVGREIDDPAALRAHLVADGVQEMRLAEADAGMEEERVVERLAVLVMGDAVGRRVGERVRAADDEAVEGQARIERRAAELVAVAALVGNGSGHGLGVAGTGHARQEPGPAARRGTSVGRRKRRRVAPDRRCGPR